MENTLTQHRIGCGSDPQGDVGLNSAPNQLTLRDIGMLHEAVSNEVLRGFNQTLFWSLMSNGLSFIDAIIMEEAESLGLSVEIAQEFRGETYTARKGGSYNSAGKIYRSGAGIIRLPFKCGEEINTQEYVFGIFIDQADELVFAFDTWEYMGEVLREEIREALRTWR